MAYWFQVKPTTRIHVADSTALRSALGLLAERLQPEVCIETGTHTAMGSTQLLIALAAMHPIERIYTIEVSQTLHKAACENVAALPGVECIWGLTVNKESARAFIQNDPLLLERGPEPDIYIDFLPDPVGGYLRELDGAVGGDSKPAPRDGILESLVPRVRNRRPLFCLDSAGGLGLFEFEQVRSLMGDAVYGLWLDDVNHVKHYRSMLRLQADPRPVSARIELWRGLVGHFVKWRLT